MTLRVILSLQGLGGSYRLLAYCTSVAIDLRLGLSVLRSETMSYILFPWNLHGNLPLDLQISTSLILCKNSIGIFTLICC
jgi:hypothetical protein